MNDALKIVLVGCLIIGVYVFNHHLFDWIFQLNQDYAKNWLGWPMLFSFFFTAVYIAVYRILTNKLKFKIVWE